MNNLMNINIAYLNGSFLPMEEIHISPDDRGFLFADGVYEVVRWYPGFFYDLEGHMERLKRGLEKILITWKDADSFPAIAQKLIENNNLSESNALIYLQVTRGVAPRRHSFPSPAIPPTVFASAKSFTPESFDNESGIGVLPGEDIRWKKCNIKSIALLPNVLSYQSALEAGFSEFVFIRDDFFTECSHSNIFFVIADTLYTHPESDYILSGITRKNVIRIAQKTGINVIEEPIHKSRAEEITEIFITNTSGEITPVVRLGKNPIGNGKPGPLTRILRERFRSEICMMKGSNGKKM